MFLYSLPHFLWYNVRILGPLSTKSFFLNKKHRLFGSLLEISSLHNDNDFNEIE